MTITQTVIFLPLVFGSYIAPPPAADLGKGVGNPWQNADCSHTALNVDWWYNWLAVDTEQCGGNFVPMVWSTETGQRLLDGTLQMADSEYVLYLNEPDLAEQANDTPAEAAAMLPVLQDKYPGRLWIVGNVYHTGWLDEFMPLCAGCDIYAVGVHHYGWGNCQASGLQAQIDEAAKFGKPVFVTELGCLSYDTDYQIASYEAWIDVLDDTGGYAFYSTKNPVGFPPVFDTLDLSGTPLGDWYAGQ